MQMHKEAKYDAFLQSKRITARSSGFNVDRSNLNHRMFPFQRDTTVWSLRRGKAALFESPGLGKTLQELEWARHVYERTDLPVMMFAPLAVSRQTQREGVKFGIEVNVCRQQSDVRPGINISNYEMLKHFDRRAFSGVVIDESSLLKGDGPLRKTVTDFAIDIPYRLAASATPAPNDYMELGNHAEFLGIMTKSEMLSTFFVHDGEDTQKWRLKGHATDAFWKFVASWAVMIQRPSDLGYDDGGFDLPPLHYHQHVVPSKWDSGYLFPVEAKSMKERREARRDSISDRVRLCADLVNSSKERWIVWCNLNDESEALTAAINGAVEVTGSQKDEYKEKTLLDFAEGRIDRLVTKGKIAGWGLNLQSCSHEALVGLSDSWELLFQMVRRCWRFGQTRPVHAHIITSEAEGAVVRNIERKERQAEEMAAAMLGHMREINTAEIHGTVRRSETYCAQKEIQIPAWL